MTIECITLADEASGSTARVLPGLGFNCFDFTVHRAAGPIDVLWAAEHFEAGTERAAGSGIPILFPFPGRIPGVVFHWEGRQYNLQAGDGRGNAIHGFVLDRAWRVIEQTANRVVGQFHASLDDPALLDAWPADFCITVSYELSGATLKSQLVVENPDHRPLPCGLGTHPYFRLPLGGTSADDCLVALPVTKRWELADMLPTGRCLNLEDVAAFQQGLRFGDLQFDDVFAGLQPRGDRIAASVHDPGSGATLQLRFDETFRECVVYVPPHLEAICIEPYTCVPGATGLDPSSVDTGWRVVPPGGSFATSLEIVVE